MVEITNIDGRNATVSYLTESFAPSTKDAAELVKLVYEDGEVAFLMPMKEKTKRKGLFGHVKRRSETV